MGSKLLKWLGIGLGLVAGLAAAAALTVYALSEARLNHRYAAPAVAAPAAVAAQVDRGRYLATAVSVCVDCHGEDLAGTVFVDDPALGRIVAPNLTRGRNGLGGQLSDADLVRVLRYGLRPDGRSVLVMPSDDYAHLSDADLAALIAYVRAAPAVDSALPASEFRPVGRLLLATDQLPILIADRIDVSAPRPEPAPGVTVDYGHYLANIAGCTGCHGPGLSGGLIPGVPPDWPPAANLTAAGEVRGWSEADFIQTIRMGVNPAGNPLSAVMPWQRYRLMTDDDLRAIWAFIQSLPAKAFGNR